MTKPKQKETETDSEYALRISEWKEMRKEYKRKWNEQNRSHTSQYNKKWQSENVEKVSQYREEYYKQNKHVITERVIDWQRKNPEKYADKSKRHYLANKDKFVTRLVKRRANLIQASIGKDVEKVYSQLYRYAKLLGGNLEVDHIIPLQGVDVRGLHTSENLCLLPREINRSKGNKFDQEAYLYFFKRYPRCTASRLYARYISDRLG